ncbi:hypothetical protein N431DRAFT_465845 [Stipitochalara longipes BDJ]|nr:hypothetical protein N431DRAFT_465845 [Stipitochalara longipes BDJ]
MASPANSKASPPMDKPVSRAPAQSEAPSEASQQHISLPSLRSTHSPGRVREQQHREIPTASSVFFGPENYSAVRDMPYESGSEDKETEDADFVPLLIRNLGVDANPTHTAKPSSSEESTLQADDEAEITSRDYEPRPKRWKLSKAFDSAKYDE